MSGTGEHQYERLLSSMDDDGTRHNEALPRNESSRKWYQGDTNFIRSMTLGKRGGDRLRVFRERGPELPTVQ